MNYSALVPNVAEHPFYDEFDKNIRILAVGEEFQVEISNMEVEILDMYDEGIISSTEMRDYFFHFSE